MEKKKKVADVLEMLVKGQLPLCLGSTASEKFPAVVLSKVAQPFPTSLPQDEESFRFPETKFFHLGQIFKRTHVNYGCVQTIAE